MCGENRLFGGGRARQQGSPPRVRGKPRYRLAHNLGVWITPACAGKTYAEELAIVIREDHPRVCGENNQSSQKFSVPAGSPPRVRGKQSLKNQLT